MKPPVERFWVASGAITPLANSIAITITTEMAISSVVRGSVVSDLTPREFGAAAATPPAARR